MSLVFPLHVIGSRVFLQCFFSLFFSLFVLVNPGPSLVGIPVPFTRHFLLRHIFRKKYKLQTQNKRFRFTKPRSDLQPRQLVFQSFAFSSTAILSAQALGSIISTAVTVFLRSIQNIQLNHCLLLQSIASLRSVHEIHSFHRLLLHNIIPPLATIYSRHSAGGEGGGRAQQGFPMEC